MTKTLTIAPEQMTWDQLKAQCAELIKTGFLPAHLKTPEQAAAVALKAREMGIGMMEAFEGLYVIQGKVAMQGQLMLAQAYRTGLVESIDIKQEPTRCVVVIKRKGDERPYVCQFGAAEALSMGLSGKDNYRKQKGTMYKWRALSDALRSKFPDALAGVHTPEELGAAVRVVGDSIEVIAEQLPPTEIPGETHTSKPSGADRFINENELKLLHAKIDHFGFKKEDVKAYAKANYGKESSKDLTVSELSKLLKYLEFGEDPPGIEGPQEEGAK